MCLDVVLGLATLTSSSLSRKASDLENPALPLPDPHRPLITVGKLARKWMGAKCPLPNWSNEGKEDLWWCPGEWCVCVCVFALEFLAVTKSLPSHRKNFRLILAPWSASGMPCTRPGNGDPKGKSQVVLGRKARLAALAWSQSQLVGESGRAAGIE